MSSIDAYICQEVIDIHTNLYTVIESRDFFNKCWMPAIEELNLKWIRVFSIGLDVTKEYLPNVLNELDKIKEWAKDNLSIMEQEHIKERIFRLEYMLKEAFKQEDITVFIG